MRDTEESARTGKGRLIVKKPWEGFIQEAREKILNITVSHRPDHRKAGGLHEDFAYREIENPSEWEKEKGFNLAKRELLSGLNLNKIKNLRNRALSAELENLLEDVPEKNISAELENHSKKTGQKRAWVLKKDKSAFEVKHPKDNPLHKKMLIPGENHCICIWKFPKGVAYDEKRRPEQPSFLHPIKGGDSLIHFETWNKFKINNVNSQDLRPHPAAKLLATLHKGDTLRLKENGKIFIRCISSIKPSSGRVMLIKPQDAGKVKKESSLAFSHFKNKEVRLVHVDILGRIKDSGPML